ncbi:MAG: TetR/AcrR family transcriptional regulator [Polyangiaceae bacterium]|nr:TetR/AcrR family transcriptional regulator [Polyangiaceae bacterium]
MRASKSAKTAARPHGSSGIQLGEASARAMILQGAASVFAVHGVRAASVEHVLEAAGVSRRTFYRLYGSKEEVAAVLYRLGTDRLLDACRLAVSEEKDPLRQVERCIDAHLQSARDFGRLVFVLGGEAQRRESALHTRRMQVHDMLVSLLATAVNAQAGRSVDPLLVRALVLALEGVTRVMLEEGNEGRHVTHAGVARIKRVMMRIATATLAGDGPGVTAMPPGE